MNKVPMTQQGADSLQKELHHLKTVIRPKVIKDIAEARAHGDLKENAEYHAAREEQGFAEGRIKEIDSKLSNAQVIDVSKMGNSGRVIFGSTVTILNINTEQSVCYQIVGEDEANVKLNKISIKSPLARALINKSEEDEVLVNTPGGEAEYEIVSVEYI